MSTWRVYNAVHEGETDDVDFDPTFPWYVALDTGMSFEIDVRFESETAARQFIRDEIAGAALEGDPNA